jgi:mRNA-degrading endonuclease HigB of HigAB toxin-antitoxin module
MRIIAWANLLDFADAHPTTRQTLMHWRAVVRAAEWKNMSDA